MTPFGSRQSGSEDGSEPSWKATISRLSFSPGSFAASIDESAAHSGTALTAQQVSWLYWIRSPSKPSSVGPAKA